VVKIKNRQKQAQVPVEALQEALKGLKAVSKGREMTQMPANSKAVKAMKRSPLLLFNCTNPQLKSISLKAFLQSKLSRLMKLL
jgi:hypothetical protein